MSRYAALLLALSIAGQAGFAESKTERSAAVVLEFKRHNPCPSTGLRRGKCPGYVVDHVRPLCAGGPDDRANMQWQTVAAAKVKDREEVRECRALRAAKKGNQ